jgi:cellulose synthase/poly-beta-1,6-N-acetylglucosamine synthase-like glycosyltransferase
VDSFTYFVAFYSLILGLGLTELLGGFAHMVRAKALKKLEPQTALLAVFILVDICSTWIDSWLTLKHVTVDFAGLWAPVLLAICFYLAASVVFPHDEADHERLADYYRERKRFVVGLLLAAEMLIHVTYLHVFEQRIAHQPELFWLWTVPYNLAIEASMVAIMFLRSRRANIVLLIVLLLLIMIPYWDQGSIQNALARQYGYG